MDWSTNDNLYYLPLLIMNVRRTRLLLKIVLLPLNPNLTWQQRQVSQHHPCLLLVLEFFVCMTRHFFVSYEKSQHLIYVAVCLFVCIHRPAFAGKVKPLVGLWPTLVECVRFRWFDWVVCCFLTCLFCVMFVFYCFLMFIKDLYVVLQYVQSWNSLSLWDRKGGAL